MRRRPQRPLAAALLAIAFGAGAVVETQGPRVSPDLYSQLRWRHIGPEGNRVSAVTGVPGDRNLYYAGSASGGIFKTTDGGLTWSPIFDGQSIHSIGEIAVAPSDPSVVWAGTGESCIRSHISVGEGIFKSTDAGKTWTRMGLERTGRIGRVVIHPKDPDTVLACALGHAYGPQPERGVFRTTDGGRTWNRVLFTDENSGCSSLEMDPRNPRKLLAGMWTLDIKTWARESGGPGSGVFASSDGGATWNRVSGRGLPTREVGKVKVAFAESNPNRVYALIETGDGVPRAGKETDRGQVWRSDDGGDTWQVVSYDRNAMGRAHYYSHLFVAPDHQDEVYFLTAGYSVSLDGGRTLQQIGGSASPGGDNHDMWIDPSDPDRMVIGNDGGVSISTTRGRSWARIRLPNAQMYHVTVDNAVPYNVMGNKQDGPSYRGPSNSRMGGRGGGGEIPRAMWHTVGGGESGWATPDPVDTNLIWSSASGSGSVGGIVVRYEENRRQGRNVEVWPDQSNGVPADLKYRFNWTMPLTISPHDRNTIYVGSQHVHRTSNGGQSWDVISPDLSLNDKSKQQFSGGLTGDNIGVEYAGVVMAIAESRLEKGLIWAGTNDGQLQLTRDGGKSWTNVTKSIPNLPPLGTFSNVEASRYDAGSAYIAVDLHQVNNRDPFVYKTTDYGKTWKAITNGIPRSMLSYARCVREDPVRRGLLYLGTENAIYVSFDDGENWQPLQNNLPAAPVYWIAVQEHFNDLVIATYGRGFWILDDITPLRDLAQAASTDVHLFAPRAAYRFIDITQPASLSNDPTVGENPPYGAIINYTLKSPPAGNVTLTIADQKGQAVRTLNGTKRAGLNRVIWDLRHEPTKEVRLRTSPLYAPETQVGPEGWRPAPGAGRFSMLAVPGVYTVSLNAGGKPLSQKIEVRKDPNSAGTLADIEQQQKVLTELRRDMDQAADLINQLEIVRSQIYHLARIVSDPEIRKAGEELDKKLIDVEWNLIELRLTGRGQDGVRFGAKLASKLNYLAGNIASGDFRPTDQHLEVKKDLEQRLRTHASQVDGLLSRELGAFNELLRKKNIPNIVGRVPTS